MKKRKMRLVNCVKVLKDLAYLNGLDVVDMKMANNIVKIYYKIQSGCSGKYLFSVDDVA